MNIFKLERFLQIDCNNTESIEKIRSKYDDLLKSSSFTTDSESTRIHFIRRNKYRGEALNVFRDGAVFIFTENDKVNVNWSVELDILYYLSGLIGLILGFTANLLFNASFSVSIITGLIGAVLTVIFGILSIISNIKDINADCLDLVESKRL